MTARLPQSPQRLREGVTWLIAHVKFPLFRNAYALLANSILTALLGIAYWAVATRIFSPAEVGLNSALISTMMFLTNVGQLNLGNASYRYLPSAGRAAPLLAAGAYGVVILATVIAALVLAVGYGLWGPERAELPITPITVLLFTGAAVLWCLFSFQDYILTSLRVTVLVPIENLVFSIMKVALLFAFADVRPFGIFLTWMIPATGAVIIVSGAIFFSFLPRHARKTEATRVPIHTSEVARYAAANYVAGLFGSAAIALIPVLVFVLDGAEASAHFYIVWLVTTALHLVPHAMFTSLMVESAALQASYERDGIRVFKQMTRLLALPTVLALLFAPQILAIFGPTYSSDGALPLRLLTIAVVPFAVISFALFQARLAGLIKRMVAIEAGIAVPALALTALLLPPLGLAGVAVAVLVSYSGVAAVLLWPGFRGWLRR